ncbi:MAG: hypothetical protein ACK55I_26085, partial [bacterium]
ARHLLDGCRHPDHITTDHRCGVSATRQLGLPRHVARLTEGLRQLRDGRDALSRWPAPLRPVGGGHVQTANR